ncbi:hypothetical protein [Paenibacillus ihumii]|uniref:hypothetical protein n=1 Tax=Paenibacillus ihumii TaxID=687436 RepID=UPI0006D7BBFD|nr:hypothetical protein [Paenibacillus ihumii]
MSERLSRMERYGQRRNPKDRQQRTGAARKHPEQHRSSEAKARVPVSSPVKSKKTEGKQPVRGQRVEVIPAADMSPAADNAFPATPYALHPLSPQAEREEADAVSVQELPSRREVYPSQRVKLTRYFFNTLLFIFIAVMVALFWWGISESPWGVSNGL